MSSTGQVQIGTEASTMADTIGTGPQANANDAGAATSPEAASPSSPVPGVRPVVPPRGSFGTALKRTTSAQITSPPTPPARPASLKLSAEAPAHFGGAPKKMSPPASADYIPTGPKQGRPLSIHSMRPLPVPGDASTAQSSPPPSSTPPPSIPLPALPTGSPPVTRSPSATSIASGGGSLASSPMDTSPLSSDGLVSSPVVPLKPAALKRAPPPVPGATVVPGNAPNGPSPSANGSTPPGSLKKLPFAPKVGGAYKQPLQGAPPVSAANAPTAPAPTSSDVSPFPAPTSQPPVSGGPAPGATSSTAPTGAPPKAKGPPPVVPKRLSFHGKVPLGKGPGGAPKAPTSTPPAEAPPASGSGKIPSPEPTSLSVEATDYDLSSSAVLPNSTQETAASPAGDSISSTRPELSPIHVSAPHTDSNTAFVDSAAVSVTANAHAPPTETLASEPAVTVTPTAASTADTTPTESSSEHLKAPENVPERSTTPTGGMISSLTLPPFSSPTSSSPPNPSPNWGGVISPRQESFTSGVVKAAGAKRPGVAFGSRAQPQQDPLPGGDLSSPFSAALSPRAQQQAQEDPYATTATSAAPTSPHKTAPVHVESNGTESNIALSSPALTEASVIPPPSTPSPSLDHVEVFTFEQDVPARNPQVIAFSAPGSANSTPVSSLPRPGFAFGNALSSSSDMIEGNSQTPRSARVGLTSIAEDHSSSLDGSHSRTEDADGEDLPPPPEMLDELDPNDPGYYGTTVDGQISPEVTSHFHALAILGREDQSGPPAPGLGPLPSMFHPTKAPPPLPAGVVHPDTIVAAPAAAVEPQQDEKKKKKPFGGLFGSKDKDKEKEKEKDKKDKDKEKDKKDKDKKGDDEDVEKSGSFLKKMGKKLGGLGHGSGSTTSMKASNDGITAPGMASSSSSPNLASFGSEGPSPLRDRLDGYSRLMELLCRPDVYLLNLIAGIVKRGDVDKQSRAWVSLLTPKGRMVDLLTKVIATEVEKTEQEGTLFRNNTFSVGLMSAFAHEIGRPYLKSVLGPLLYKMLTSGLGYEINPEKAEGGPIDDDTIDNNTINLLEACGSYVEAIVKSLPEIPSDLRRVCTLLRQYVQTKFPNSVNTAVGGFFFLRFLTPAVVSPEGFGVHPQEEPISIDSRRPLILISKTLQQISNEMFFSEDHMQSLNTFITDNIPIFQQFFQDICNPVSEEPAVVPFHPYTHESNKVRDDALIKLHAFVHKSLPEIKQAAQTESFPASLSYDPIAELEKVLVDLGEPPDAKILKAPVALPVVETPKSTKKK